MSVAECEEEKKPSFLQFKLFTLHFMASVHTYILWEDHSSSTRKTVPYCLLLFQCSAPFVLPRPPRSLRTIEANSERMNTDTGTNTYTSINPSFTIPTVSPTLSYNEAFHRFFVPNRPFIIKDLTRSWPASKDWIQSSLPNWDYLVRQYGNEKVTVHDCSSQDAIDSNCSEMLFKEVVSIWKEGNGQSLYIKDWHLPLHRRKDHLDNTGTPFYDVPDLFKDDWMDHHARKETGDDFAFVYFGGKQTYTHLHRDVCGSMDIYQTRNA